MKPLAYSDYIVQDPQICGGEPVVRSTRVSIRAVIAFAAASAVEDLPRRAVPALR